MNKKQIIKLKEIYEKSKRQLSKFDSVKEPTMEPISEASTSKKISSFSAMMVGVGSSVGT